MYSAYVHSLRLAYIYAACKHRVEKGLPLLGLRGSLQWARWLARMRFYINDQ